MCRSDSAHLPFEFVWLLLVFLHLQGTARQLRDVQFRRIVVSLSCGLLISCEIRSKKGHVEKSVCDVTTAIRFYGFVLVLAAILWNWAILFKTVLSHESRTAALIVLFNRFNPWLEEMITSYSKMSSFNKKRYPLMSYYLRTCTLGNLDSLSPFGISILVSFR